jgi:hypothetical protein
MGIILIPMRHDIAFSETKIVVIVDFLIFQSMGNRAVGYTNNYLKFLTCVVSIVHISQDLDMHTLYTNIQMARKL